MDSLIIVTLCCVVCQFVGQVACEPPTYLNQWVIHVSAGPQRARQIADTHGFHFEGAVSPALPHYFLLTHHSVHRRSVDSAPHHHTRLAQEDEVLWTEQQVVKRRVKRGVLDHARSGIIVPTATPGGHNASTPWFKDPLWRKQWYLQGGAAGGHDVNVQGAWRQGYTGRGVVVTILDDGIEHSHPDLHQNYDPQASTDINSHDSDPMPRYEYTNENKHGTRCAGEVAAAANNSFCVVGAAFRAGIGGVRMLDGDVTDYVEAKSLSWNPQHVDIYSASWGPDDNGREVDGPAKLATEAFIQGVLQGRRGRGSIFVWASGNGGMHHDSCNCDGYTNAIYTISISSASETGMKPWYLEECASTLATTYSSGQMYGERNIVSTDLHGKCTQSHTGTSASAPLAAGLLALALEAKPALTWRDMQYVVVMTSRADFLHDGEWVVNGAGRRVSHRYGFGMMDAGAMTRTAKTWNLVAEQHICMSNTSALNKTITRSGLTLELDTDACNGTVNEVRWLEHVQAKLSLNYSRRGDLKIVLVSPNGTRSTLLHPRLYDSKEHEFKDWPFMSVHYWGEHANGTWKLEIENNSTRDNVGMLLTWDLILYGVAEEPQTDVASEGQDEGVEDGLSELFDGVYSMGEEHQPPPIDGVSSLSEEHQRHSVNGSEDDILMGFDWNLAYPWMYDSNDSSFEYARSSDELPLPKAVAHAYYFRSSLFVSLCSVIIVCCLLVIGLVMSYARSHQKLCWRHQYETLPKHFLSDLDSDFEDDSGVEDDGGVKIISTKSRL